MHNLFITEFSTYNVVFIRYWTLSRINMVDWNVLVIVPCLFINSCWTVGPWSQLTDQHLLSYTNFSMRVKKVGTYLTKSCIKILENYNRTILYFVFLFSIPFFFSNLSVNLLVIIVFSLS